MVPRKLPVGVDLHQCSVCDRWTNNGKLLAGEFVCTRCQSSAFAHRAELIAAVEAWEKRRGVFLEMQCDLRQATAFRPEDNGRSPRSRVR